MHPPTKEYYERLVAKALFPGNTSKNSQSFDQFVRHEIVPEVRQENQRFYGREDDRGVQQDALYPGHDYNSAWARTRLGAYPAHQRLFAAFDYLGLSEMDINSLCTWEGTRSAKERFEAENGEKVVDITLHAISSLTPSPRRVPTIIHHPVKRRSTAKSPHGKDGKDNQPITPTRRSKPDYYGDPQIWSNNNTPPAIRAKDTEDAYRQVLSTYQQRPIQPAHPLQTVNSYMHASVPNYLNWNQWYAAAQQSGAYLASGADNARYSAHVPAHYAPATPAYHYGPYSQAPYSPMVYPQTPPTPQTPERAPRHTTVPTTPTRSPPAQMVSPGIYLYTSQATGTNHNPSSPLSPTARRRSISHYTTRATEALASLSPRHRRRMDTAAR